MEKFTITFEASDEETLRESLKAFIGIVSTPKRVRRSKAEIKAGIPLETVKSIRGIETGEDNVGIETYEAGEISAPDESEFDD